MSVGAAVFWGVVIVGVIYAILLYNGLVRLKHGVAKAWANIDVALKQRHDELPKLVEACRQYQQFEQATLQAVTEARARVQSAREAHDVPALSRAEGALRAGLGQIFAVAEAYPELKANEHFMQLQQRISGLESLISDRRELYNEAVNLYNVRLESFPDLLLARLLALRPQALLTFADEEKADVDLRRLFGR
ncbi:MAG: LemA family protein [Hylemonella sp.]